MQTSHASDALSGACSARQQLQAGRSSGTLNVHGQCRPPTHQTRSVEPAVQDNSCKLGDHQARSTFTADTGKGSCSSRRGMLTCSTALLPSPAALAPSSSSKPRYRRRSCQCPCRHAAATPTAASWQRTAEQAVPAPLVSSPSTCSQRMTAGVNATSGKLDDGGNTAQHNTKQPPPCAIPAKFT
jgi:hypothetical protein